MEFSVTGRRSRRGFAVRLVETKSSGLWNLGQPLRFAKPDARWYFAGFDRRILDYYAQTGTRR